MRSAIVRIDESRVEVELIDLVKFRPEALGWHFRYPQAFSTGDDHPSCLERSGTMRTIRTKSAKILISDLGVRQDFIKNREELH